MRTYSIRRLLLFVLAISFIAALTTHKIEVCFDGDQLGDLQKGWRITLHEGDRYASKTTEIDGVFVAYQAGKKSFTARISLLDWFKLKNGCDYSLEAPEQLFWPTVRMKGNRPLSDN